MNLQIDGLVLVFVVALVAFVRGQKYSAMVSELEKIDNDGVCHKMVTVTGKEIVDRIPVRCDMANYVVTNDKLLVVGDKIYSDKVDTLMVLTSQGCEQRTYSNGALAKIVELKDDDCAEVKLMMMKAFLSDDDDQDTWNVDDDDDDGDDVSESQLNAYDELRKWASDYLDSDEGTEKNSKQGDNKDDDNDLW